jgi:hypothetical protein
VHVGLQHGHGLRLSCKANLSRPHHCVFCMVSASSWVCCGVPCRLFCTHDASTCAPHQLFTCAGAPPPLCTGLCKQLECCLLTVCQIFGLSLLLPACLPACYADTQGAAGEQQSGIERAEKLLAQAQKAAAASKAVADAAAAALDACQKRLSEAKDAAAQVIPSRYVCSPAT